MVLKAEGGRPLGVLIPDQKPPRRGFWARAKDAARQFYHVREPSVWETLGFLI